MKTYQVQAGQRYTLAGLTDGVKEQIEDAVQAKEKTRSLRQFKAGLIAPDVYAADKQGILALSFDSEACVKYCTITAAGIKHLIRLLLEEGGKLPVVRDADVEAIYAAYRDPTSEVHQTFLRIWEEAFPKARTSLSTAPSDATSGGPSSAESPSG